MAWIPLTTGFFLAHSDFAKSTAWLTVWLRDGYVLLCLFGAGAIIPIVLRMFYTNVYPQGIFLIGAGIQEFDSVRSRRSIVSPLAIGITHLFAMIAASLLHWLGL